MFWNEARRLFRARKPDIQQRYTALGVETAGSTPEYLAKYLLAEMAKWADVVKRSGLRAE